MAGLKSLASSLRKKLHLGGKQCHSTGPSTSNGSIEPKVEPKASIPPAEPTPASEDAPKLPEVVPAAEMVVSASPQLLSTSLEGKVAVVTGSSRSIGAAIAKALGSQGAKVVVNYVNDSSAAQSVVDEIKTFDTTKSKGCDAIAVQADASKLEGGQKLLAEATKTWGQVDILVLNAGIMGSKPLAEVDEDFFDSHFEINVKVPVFLAKAAVPLMSTPGGRIIFFSTSLTGLTPVLPNALTYVASKGAVEQVARVLAKDLGSRGLTVNTVSPGPVDTPLFRAGKPEEVIKKIAAQNPNNRVGLPEDIAPMVAFVASPAAQWINGQNLRVNGGAVL
ncbi:NAD(P)-binding protein [Pleurotus eryngii]|uniref:NAD(P)-binding protein n=1 Tax=Pleurotus eryngii TaxID=5323 RepID=A0A9P6D0U2_PLEER|nr:NAD(P)-binding protein [Pleurotus eryngii]